MFMIELQNYTMIFLEFIIIDAMSYHDKREIQSRNIIRKIYFLTYMIIVRAWSESEDSTDKKKV